MLILLLLLLPTTFPSRALLLLLCWSLASSASQEFSNGSSNNNSSSSSSSSSVTVILAETTESGENAVANIQIVPAHDHLSLQPSEAEKSVIGGLTYMNPPSASPQISGGGDWANNLVDYDSKQWNLNYYDVTDDSVVNDVTRDDSYYNAASSYDPNYLVQQQYYEDQLDRNHATEYKPAYTDHQFFDSYGGHYIDARDTISAPPPPPKPPTRPPQQPIERIDVNEDDLTPSFTGFMRFLKEKALSPLKYLYKAATSTFYNNSTSKDEITEKSDLLSPSQASLAQRILEGDFEFRELVPSFEDPVTNWILGFATLALITQGLTTPFGSVVVANPGGTAPGSRDLNR